MTVFLSLEKVILYIVKQKLNQICLYYNLMSMNINKNNQKCC